ncbi:MAG: small multi-drug export protein [Anaerolineae bacterium]|nr:small multi-drug export protein [Anaerolineae bacterium]
MLQVVTIFLLALLSLWAAAGLGLALGIAPLPLLVALTLANALVVLIVVMVGRPLCDRLLARHNCMNSPAGRVLRKYGVVGLALVSPLSTGAALGTALGIALNVPPRRLIIAMTIGAAVWSLFLVTVRGF